MDASVSADGLEVGETDRRDAVMLAGLGVLAPSAFSAVLGGAAAEAMEFTRQAEASMLGAGTLEHLNTAITEFDLAYSRQPPAALFTTALTYRRHVARLIEGAHTLRQGRELVALAGWLSELLAWLAHDLGDARTGHAFALDSYRHGEEAGYDELCAWAMDAATSIALYSNRPDRSLDTARRGLEHAPVGHPLGVRMHAQAARALAAAGDADGYHRHMAQAHDAYDALPARPASRFGGDVLPLAEYALTSYPATASIWLGRPEQAKTHAETALATYASAPVGARSPSREAIARLDLALAYAHLGALDDAASVAQHALASSRVVDSVRTRASDLAAYLNHRWPSATMTADFAERLRALTAPTTTSDDDL
jgi:tetratricopeptide (TPR) repeat protein